MREVSLETFAAAHADGALVIDVREPHEYVEGHVPNARMTPMSQVPGLVGELPRSEPVYVICASGNRSLAVTDYLLRVGVQARSVAGGTSGWKNSGRPVTVGRHANVAA